LPIANRWGALHFKSELKNIFNPDYLLKNDLVFIGSQMHNKD